MTACLPRLIPSVLLLLSLLADCSHVFAQQADVLLQAVDGQRWMKGNMHTHSLWSDGDDFPENLAKWYRDKGYQFLVFTDHNTLLQKERWFSLAKRKGSEKALQRLREQWPADWIESRGEGDATEIRLKTFDEIFARLAVPQEYL
ncbi:MAG: PHP domain-containing protein, partial [Planctomycetaceae bacterium]